MRKNSKGLKVLWAVDAFESSSETEKNVVSFIASLNESVSTNVEAVSILSPDQLQVPVELTRPWVDKFSPAARKLMLSKISKTPIAGIIHEVKVLHLEESSLTSAVKRIISHARKNKVQAIVLGTHARKGMGRLFLGSFAETLLLHADVPVVVVGKNSSSTNKKSKLSKILFPSDFSAGSFEIFKSVVQFAKQTGASVSIYHSVVDPIEPVVQSGVYLMGGGWVPVSHFYEDQIQDKEKFAEKWKKWAKGQKVKVDAYIEKKNATVTDSILGAAKKYKADLIAMEGKSGVIGATLVGSVVRAVVRTGEFPVWVWHPKKSQKKNVKK